MNSLPGWAAPLIAVGFWAAYIGLLNVFFSWRERLTARAKLQRLINARTADEEDTA